MVTLQTKVEELSVQLINLDNKHEDLEARSRRNNIRILGVPEDSTNFSTTAAVSALLKEAFKLDEESLVDRARLSLQPKPKPSERPRYTTTRTVLTSCDGPGHNNASGSEMWSSPSFRT